MTLAERLNQIISEQKITKRECARRVGIFENYLYILTSNSRKKTNQNKTISTTLAKLIAEEFGYSADRILNGETENESNT